MQIRCMPDACRMSDACQMHMLAVTGRGAVKVMCGRKGKGRKVFEWEWPGLMTVLTGDGSD